ncbi:translation initiation factor IF-2 subunit beta [Candidatus Pacearchaeota archaeon CG_4_9_14_0_2_um_filter_39_13]|nr:translation initiation factor IF-2 subunit beta [Candidatus Pacearchaeota archaeon]OIO43136.1 MAG: translation initiation factor IF-2 subunit beta [Candidatus Pacearchaeota archaeon CG1_02_39_14]PJC44704.1 MAG: translation initiation factor IF-2 subunit beta [Candidatus Pacearchaeota archaeon CG_4_9_14_0_2_um_filter_39_13]
MEYEKLLEKAYNEIKVVDTNSDRFEVPAVKGQVAGKNTIITNITEIASYIRRPLENLAKYLLKELAVSGKMDNSRLILNRRLSSTLVNEKVQLYVKEFVLCHECKKPDTEIISEKGIKFKHCLACGAKYPIKSKI